MQTKQKSNVSHSPGAARQRCRFASLRVQICTAKKRKAKDDNCFGARLNFKHFSFQTVPMEINYIRKMEGIFKRSEINS